MQIPHQEGYRNVRLVNYLKGCAASEALPIKPIRDEGLFAHCQGRNAIKKKKKDPQPCVCLPSQPNLPCVQGVADGWACMSEAWESPSINTHPSPCPRCASPLSPQLGQVIQVYIYLFPLILFFISSVVSRPVRLINI